MNGDRRRPWSAKFGDAFRGIRVGCIGQSSFIVHIAFGIAAIILAAALRVTLVEWCLIILCIALVLAAELFNTAIEHLARAIGRNPDPQIGIALDVAAAGVLVTALGSAAVGATIFLYRLGVLLKWWN